MTSEAYVISPRKIGSYVKKLNIKILRDSEGRYIPVLEEYLKIKVLARRYGLDKLVEMPDKLNLVPPPKPEIECGNVHDDNDDDDGESPWPEEGLDKKDSAKKVDSSNVNEVNEITD